jgi:hypothetical protein
MGPPNHEEKVELIITNLERRHNSKEYTHLTRRREKNRVTQRDVSLKRRIAGG